MGVLRIYRKAVHRNQLTNMTLRAIIVSIISSLTLPAREERLHRHIVPGPPDLNRNQAFEPGARLCEIKAFITERNKQILSCIPHWLGDRNGEDGTYF